ncbi:glucosamine-6-phosphate deaminase [Priestia aryabhattai]|uniref:glucosamine-6-phosphate deaminase n=1 Tax=Priestia aryabhattai TaxID=412384 RepID=UPI0003A5F45E|nr:glucosamine-6-phosphate deaminase [Priestia aryabhattai]MED4023488.1 glucosamine-6-phosphate deaminase [Priestia aryabhattai]MED4391804.1 glucosamine-6-phosphate deaminase [Priestia aryabhattai]
MNIIQVKNYSEMSAKAADMLISKLHEKPNMNLGLATGGTPKGLYDRLIQDHKEHGTSYKHVTSFNLDEYVGMKPQDPNSYHYYMADALFNHIDIDVSNTHVPNGLAETPEEECRRYDEMIQNHGGIDLQILGIGQNGHIGFNEPGTSFNSPTHIVTLEESTRKANARYFNSLDEVPTQAITMGIESIMKSKEILLLISGEAKAEAMYQLLNGEITEDFPASILKKHHCVTIIADQEALAKVSTTV